MKMEWLDTSVTVIWSPVRAESELFWVILGVFLADLGRYCGWGATLWPGNLPLRPENLTYDRLMKIEWLITTIVILDPRYVHTHDIVIESQVVAQVYRVIRSDFVTHKLLQVVVNCLCRVSDPPRMFKNGVWTWLILLWGSLLADGTWDVSFRSHNMSFCFLMVFYFEVILVHTFGG